MAGVFEITDTTILKILVRRGTEAERQNIRLDEGELGYTIDSKRLFIGDGLGGGGNVAGNIFQGAFPNVDTVINSLPVGFFQPGDSFYDTNESTLYALDETGLASGKVDIGPRYEELVLEKTTSPTGRVRISDHVFGKTVIGVNDYRKAFWFDYDTAEPFYGTIKVAELNSNYWAITSQTDFNPSQKDGVFYFGDIKLDDTKCDLDYRVNINTTGLSEGALAVYSPTNDIFVIKTEGNFGNIAGSSDLFGLSGINFFPGQSDNNNPSSFLLTSSGTAYFQKTGGTSSQPAFRVDGFSRFTNSVMIDNDCLVLGNLTALGDFTVLETYVSVTSALSVINQTAQDAVTVYQQQDNYNTAKFFNDNFAYNRVIFDRYCNASFGRGFGSVSRGSPTSSNTSAISSVHIAGGLVVRDVVTAEGGNLGRVDIDMNGEIISKTGFNFFDANVNGHYFSKGRVNPSTLPTDHVVQIFTDSTSSPTALKVVGRPAFGPSMVLGSTTGSGAYKILSVRHTSNGPTNSDGTETFQIQTNGYFESGISTNAGATINGDLLVIGNIRAQGGDVIAYYTSDERLKLNVASIESPLEKIDKISGVSFDWSEESGYMGHDIGVIAQEVEKILPEAVETRANGYKAVRYEKIIPLLIECIKDLKKKLEDK